MKKRVVKMELAVMRWLLRVFKKIKRMFIKPLELKGMTVEQLLKALMEHKGWIAQNLIRDYLLKHDKKLLNQIIDDNDLRNTIYQDEKARREGKAERRERRHQFEIERQRRQDQHKASIATRKALNFYHDILGITEDD